MPPILQRAAAIAIKNAIRSTAVDVVYTSDGDDLAFVAGLGSFRVTQEGLDGQPVRIDLDDHRDLIAWPADLTVEPQNGDTVVVTLRDAAETSIEFEVVSIGSEPCWRWTDRFQTARRVHLRKV